ncbi:MAG TPA: methyltransferase domain-containing protein [Pseudobdellovibrionaceae bacterium]|nr:methyltransferase domain-containing protein [Pseudobdellovibrionaceae bacterium]
MTVIWKLKKGADRRPRSGHPWVYSHELAQSPKGLVPGSLVELQDDQGRFVARGYGNPNSVITFRAVSFDPKEWNPLDRKSMIHKILDAWKSRLTLGFRESFRMVFSEGDRLPGLIIDSYVGEQDGKRICVFATQILTAGMQKAIGETETFFKDLVDEALTKELTDIPWENSAVVLRNDVRSRQLEGLTEDLPRFVKSVRGAEFTDFPIRLNAALDDGFVEMNCDLFGGQKTGFFLDQTANIQAVVKVLDGNPFLPKDRPVRILDLCCYVGHWSAQLTRVLRRKGFEVEVTQVDVSEKALQFAKKNAERQGARVITRQGDVMKVMTSLKKEYDIVIADPPAFVKAKKDIPLGRHAYLKINTQAFRVALEGGLVVSCSCSGLFNEDDFRDVLAKAIRRNFLDARCVLRGGPAPDHPGRLGFPDGMYLKMFTHLVGAQAIGAVVETDGDVAEGALVEPEGDA